MTTKKLPVERGVGAVEQACLDVYEAFVRVDSAAVNEAALELAHALERRYAKQTRTIRDQHYRSR